MIHTMVGPAPFCDSTMWDKLAKLNESRQSISGLTMWVIHHRKHAGKMASAILESLVQRKSVDEKRTLLYLLSDLATSSKGSAVEVFDAVKGVLGRVADAMCSPSTDPKLKPIWNTLVDNWCQQHTFTEDFLATFVERPPPVEAIDPAAEMEREMRELSEIAGEFSAPDISGINDELGIVIPLDSTNQWDKDEDSSQGANSSVCYDDRIILSFGSRPSTSASIPVATASAANETAASYSPIKSVEPQDGFLDVIANSSRQLFSKNSVIPIGEARKVTMKKSTGGVPKQQKHLDNHHGHKPLRVKIVGFKKCRHCEKHLKGTAVCDCTTAQTAHSSSRKSNAMKVEQTASDDESESLAVLRKREKKPIRTTETPSRQHSKTKAEPPAKRVKVEPVEPTVKPTATVKPRVATSELGTISNLLLSLEKLMLKVPKKKPEESNTESGSGRILNKLVLEKRRELDTVREELRKTKAERDGLGELLIAFQRQLAPAVNDKEPPQRLMLKDTGSARRGQTVSGSNDNLSIAQLKAELDNKTGLLRSQNAKVLKAEEAAKMDRIRHTAEMDELKRQKTQLEEKLVSFQTKLTECSKRAENRINMVDKQLNDKEEEMRKIKAKCNELNAKCDGLEKSNTDLRRSNRNLLDDRNRLRTELDKTSLAASVRGVEVQKKPAKEAVVAKPSSPLISGSNGRSSLDGSHQIMQMRLEITALQHEKADLAKRLEAKVAPPPNGPTGRPHTPLNPPPDYKEVMEKLKNENRRLREKVCKYMANELPVSAKDMGIPMADGELRNQETLLKMNEELAMKAKEANDTAARLQKQLDQMKFQSGMSGQLELIPDDFWKAKYNVEIAEMLNQIAQLRALLEETSQRNNQLEMACKIHEEVSKQKDCENGQLKMELTALTERLQQAQQGADWFKSQATILVGKAEAEQAQKNAEVQRLQQQLASFSGGFNPDCQSPPYNGPVEPRPFRPPGPPSHYAPY